MAYNMFTAQVDITEKGLEFDITHTQKKDKTKGLSPWLKSSQHRPPIPIQPL